MEELRTLYLATFTVTATGLGISFYIYYSIYKYRGASDWLLGVTLAVFGTLLIPLRGVLPDFITIQVGNTFLIVAPFFISRAVRHFFLVPGKGIPDLVAMLFFVALFWYVAAMYGLRERILAISFAYGVLWLFPAWNAIRLIRVKRSQTDWFMFSLGLLFSLVSFIRAQQTFGMHAGENFFELSGFLRYYMYIVLSVWFSMMIAFLLMVNRHLSNSLESQKEKLQSALDSRDKLFRVLAHDMRGSMGAMLMSLEEMHDQENGSKPPPLLGIALRQARKLDRIFEDVLTWARSQQNLIQYKKERLSVVELLSGVISPLQLQAQKKNVSIEDSLKGGFEIMGDRETLTLALRNLLNNAIKFSHPGGRVEFKAYREDRSVVLDVVDSGTGIAENALAQMQSGEFIQSTPGTSGETGTGFGLSIVREYVRGNGGTLEISSREGEGSRFSVRLPLAE